MDRRLRLAQQMLQLPVDGPLSEQQRKLSIATTDAVLLDFTRQIGLAIEKRGPGIPFIDPDGHVSWQDPEELKKNLDTAVRMGDTAMVDTLRGALELLGNLDVNDHVLSAVIDSSGIRIYRLPTHDPARGIRELLEDWGR